MQRVSMAFSQGIKQPERETKHLRPISAEAMNADLYIHFPIRRHGMMLFEELCLPGCYAV